MASSDTLGYPIKKHFYRIHLENAWRAAFGALDIGDFETFLKESADRTYPDALAQIRKIGAGRSEISQIKEAQGYEAQGGIEQYMVVADELRQEGKEYEASAIEALIADLVAAQSKAKTQRKPAEKREPKQKPLESVPEKPQTITKPGISAFEFGADFERIKDMIIKDGDKNLQDAKILIAAKETKLTDADRFELSEMLTTAEQGITPMKAPERIHKPQKPKPEISTGKDIFKKEEGEEVPRRGTRTRDNRDYDIKQLRAAETAGTARADTAYNAAHVLKSHINEIMLYGLREYIQKNNINLPVNSTLLAMLAEELISIWFQKVREPKNVRESIGQAIVKREGVMLLASGIEYIKDSNTMREMYEIVKAQNKDIPAFDVVVKDVANIILKVK